MPVMDRFEVAKTIKNDPSLRNIKIVMLSSVGKLNHKQIQEYDIDDSVAKPVKQSNLFDTIMQVLRIPVKKVVTVAPVVSLEIQPDRKHLRILVAEDNVDNQNLAKTFLQKAGYTAGIAENGKLAVDAVRNLPYDLILMDVRMPEMDGFEATGEIRRWEKETEPRLYFAANGQAAFDICKRRIFSLLLMDMEMPVMDGYTATTAIRQLEHCEEDSCNSDDSPSGNYRNQYVFKCRLYGFPFKTGKKGSIAGDYSQIYCIGIFIRAIKFVVTTSVVTPAYCIVHHKKATEVATTNR